MKILVVCQYYYPEQFQINDICEELVKRGYDVDVLTGLPNYPTGIVPEEYKNGKKSYEIINGVNVYRTYEIGRKKGAVGMAKNYLSFCYSASRWAKKTRNIYDIVLVYQLSPVLMAYPASIIKKRQKVPMLLYCCDLWPESMKLIIKNEKNIAFKFIKSVSSYLYKCADLIIVQSKSFLSYFEEIHKIEKENLRYIPQFGDSEYLKINETIDNGVVDFVFLGNIGIAQDIDTIIDAVDMVKDIDNFCVHFVGDGSYREEAETKVKQLGLEEKIKFYGRRPLEDMPEFYKLADVCLVTLKANTVIGKTLPSKVQGYMAAGKTIIAALDGAAKDVINEAKCGLCVPAGNASELANAMKNLINEPQKYYECGSNARKYFKEHFTKEVFMNSLEEAINSFGE